jgi:4-amino-4-deoxy-L-arabinose transferase-like glycosyltransferase
VNPIADKKNVCSVLKILSPFLLLLLVILYVVSLNRHWKPEWDSAYFFTLAKSIIEGKGFSYLGHPCLKVPFGFPLLMSPLLWLFGPNFLVFNIMMTGIALLSLWALYKYFSLLFSKEYAMLITFLVGTSYLMMFYSGYIMSDTPYFLFSMLALFCTHQFLNRQSNAFRYGIAAALCLLACYFMRTIGITLIPAIAIAVILHKSFLLRLRQLAFLALLILIPISAWTIRNKMESSDYKDPVWHQLQEFVTYKDTFLQERYDRPNSQISIGNVAKRSVANSAYYAGNTSMTIVSKRIETGMSEVKALPKNLLLLLIAPALVTAFGFLLDATRRKDVYNFYVVFYLGMLIVWPAREERYLLPILPFIFHYFLTGLMALTARIQGLLTLKIPYAKYLSSVILVLFCGFLVFSNLRVDFGIIRSQHAEPYYSPEMQQLMDVTQWVQKNTEKDARIVSVNAPVVAFFAERWCVSFPWMDDHTVILRMLKKVGAKYLIVGPQLHDEQKYLMPIVKDNPSIFQLRYSKGETFVYEVENSTLQKLLSEPSLPPSLK